MTSLPERESARDILVEGLQDWIDLGFARQYVSDEVGDVPVTELGEQTIGVIEHLLRAGLVVAGDVWDGFTPWPLDPEATVARIRTEWDQPAAQLLPGDICWFEITESGATLARRIRAER
ncbi:hypothetical protein ACQPX6_21140 [Actinomycetospora sp. CA-101289]|uniref:hypothetical protein n=1 Tax=Actinomycetospora sp. CA-101289 TaxID=3239893 RepID=UPI003D99AC8A